MITRGRTQARDDMFTAIRNGVLNSVYANTELLWQDEVKDFPVDEIFVAVTVQHRTGEQTALAQDVGQRRWQSNGVISVLVQAPEADGGLTTVDHLSTLIEEILRMNKTPNGVWFRGVVGKELPAKNGNTRAEISAEFIYQEMG